MKTHIDPAVARGLKIALAYALMGIVWIAFSDQLVNWLFVESSTILKLSIFKGILFVTLSAATIYVLVVRRERQLEEGSARILHAEHHGFLLATEANQRRLESLIKTRTEELEIALAQSESAVQAKSIFLANMSHEIRTPLNAILGSAHLLKQTHLDPNQQDKTLQIEQAGQNLLRLLNGVLALSSIEAGELVLQPTDFDLSVFLDDVCREAVTEIQGKPIQLGWEPSAVPTALCGDVARLKLALGHYLANAAKFTEKGRITVHVELLNHLENSQAIFRFSVRDTGVGVQPERIPHLFAPFTQGDGTTSRRYSGSGLGLAIVRRLAVMMGGDAGGDSQPGQGSWFWFTARLGYQAGALLPEGPTKFFTGVEPASLSAVSAESELPMGWPESLRVIQGLDLKRAKDISRGQFERFARLLRMFAESHQNDVDQLRLAMGVPSDIDRAISIAHALKGAAGNLGATVIFDVAQKIVDGLRLGQTVDSLRPCLDELSTLLPAFNAAILDVTAEDAKQLSAEPRIDRQALMDRIQALLADGDMSVNELVRGQTVVLAEALGEGLEGFIRRVELFDYEGALVHLKQYRRE